MKDRMLLTIALAVGLTLLEKIFPQILYLIYAYPAAFLASLFFGSHPVFNETYEIMIPLAGHAINVVPSCSAYGFFCLLYAMVVSFAWCHFDRRKAALFAVLAVPGVWGITVVTNALRIICVYYVNHIGKILLSPKFHAALHMGVGIFLFLPVMISVCLLLERISHHGFKR